MVTIISIVVTIALQLQYAKVKFNNLKSYIFMYIIIIANDVLHTNCTDYDVKLVDGNSPNEGKVVVCINGVWGLVCDNSIDLKAAGVMCYQLGYDRGE